MRISIGFIRDWNKNIRRIFSVKHGFCQEAPVNALSVSASRLLWRQQTELGFKRRLYRRGSWWKRRPYRRGRDSEVPMRGTRGLVQAGDRSLLLTKMDPPSRRTDTRREGSPPGSPAQDQQVTWRGPGCATTRSRGVQLQRRLHWARQIRAGQVRRGGGSAATGQQCLARVLWPGGRQTTSGPVCCPSARTWPSWQSRTTERGVGWGRTESRVSSGKLRGCTRGGFLVSLSGGTCSKPRRTLFATPLTAFSPKFNLTELILFCVRHLHKYCGLFSEDTFRLCIFHIWVSTKVPNHWGSCCYMDQWVEESFELTFTEYI